MFRKQGDPRPVATPEREALPPPVTPPRAGVTAPEGRAEATRIAQSIVVKGELSGREDLFFDGTLEGRIRVPDARVVIGPNGRVQAEVEADEIVVEGQVGGNLRARTRVELRRTSRVRGDVTAERIAIHEGAEFHGRIDLVRGEEARGARAASASASEGSYPAIPVSAAGEPNGSIR